MRNVFLIAWREYADNAKTKGFWIGLLIVPLLLYGMITVPMWLEERATPIRHFVFLDQSGQLEKVVAAALERDYYNDARKALQQFAGKHAKEDMWSKVDLEKMPLPNQNRGDDWEWASGLDADEARSKMEAEIQSLVAQMKPFLKEDAPPFELPRRDYSRIDLPDFISPDADFATIARELKPYLRGDKRLEAEGEKVKLHAAILIPSNVEELVRKSASPMGAKPEEAIEYWSANLADTRLRDLIERTVNSEMRRRQAEARGLDLAAYRETMRAFVPVADLNPNKEEGQEQVSLADRMRQWAPSGFVYMLWLAIFSIVQTLLNNTIEEKSNRLIEVLLSSVTPGELMMGKLSGILAIGLTVTGTWILALIGVLAWKAGPQSEVASQLLGVLRTSNLLPAFVIYYLIGFLMYSAIILAIGSICNTIKESQNLMGIIVIIMMVPLLTMMFIPRDPNGSLATILSWIPIYTPFVMMNRVAAHPPLFDVVGTFVLMVITTAIILWAAGKIFRIGILRSGQPPKILELIRWLRT